MTTNDFAVLLHNINIKLIKLMLVFRSGLWEVEQAIYSNVKGKACVEPLIEFRFLLLFVIIVSWVQRICIERRNNMVQFTFGFYCNDMA